MVRKWTPCLNPRVSCRAGPNNQTDTTPRSHRFQSATTNVTDESQIEATTDRLIRSASALLISNVTGALLGVVFWVVAAHRYSAVNVGNGAAEIAAMNFLATIAQFSPGLIFNRFLFASGARAAHILRVGYSVSVGAALTVASVFLFVSGRHSYIEPGPWSSITFVFAVALWVVFTIEDTALIGLRATFVVPIENTSFSLAKLALLPLLAVSSPRSGVFQSWIFPVVVAVIPVNYYLFRRVIPRHVAQSQGRSLFPTRRVLSRMLAGEYFGSLALMGLMSLPSLLIVHELGGAAAAYFQTPWLVGTSFDFLLWTIATALTSEAAARPSSAPGAVRKAVRFTMVVVTPTIIVLVIGAPYFLKILGHSYSHNGARLLQLLILTVPFMAVNILYVTFARLARRVRRVIIIQVGLAVVTLTLMSILMRHHGLNGVGVAFLIGQATVAVIVFPSVYKQYRRPNMGPGFSPDSSLVINVGSKSIAKDGGETP